ncbi:MAG: hypothetical protein N3A62_01930 [Thermodesulfovibrionales bacterium]|nr:hypothetical protein [Thermodesulfovibrionales bacterium]
MGTNTLTLPESAFVDMLKALPQESLLDIFYKAVIQNDLEPLSEKERKDREKAKEELKKGQTINWKDIK